MDTPTRPLNRKEASTYLYEVYGIRRSLATLAKLACLGGGPTFRKVNRTPLYSAAELDRWATEITSRPVRSTAELRGVA